MTGTPSIQITTPGGVTDAVTLALSGTASDLNFAMVSVYDNDAYVGPAGVYNGTWSMTVAPTPGDNSYTAVGLATTDSGVSSAAVVLTDLRISPSIAIAQAGGPTDGATQTLSGTATTAGYGARFTAGTALTLSDDGAVVGHATVAADGTWSTQVALTGSGDNLVTVDDTDAAGNTGGADVLFTLKTSAPAVAITGVSGSATGSAQLISGTATAGDVGDAITVFQDGNAIGTTSVGPAGLWALSAVLPPGSHTFQATDADLYGNVGTSNAYAYVPTATSTTPAAAGAALTVSIAQAGGDTNAAAQTLSGTATTAGYGAQLTVGTVVTLSDDGAVVGHATVAADGTWSAPVALTGQGSNLVTATDTDGAGNTGEGVVGFSLKTSVPAVAITSAGGAVTAPVQVISGTATAGDTGDVVTVIEDGTAIGTAAVGNDGTWALATTLSAGPHTFQATDADLYGNVGVSNAVAYALSTPPAVAPTPPSVAFGPAPQLAGTMATLTGTASDAGGIKGVEIYDGTTDLGAAQVGGDGTWTFTHDFGQGSYEHLTAVATGAAGNSAPAAALFDLDTGITGRRYTGKVTTTDASGAVTGVTTTARDGTTGSQTVRNPDGTATSAAFENGQALFSIGGDTMTGGGMRENFVFQPTMGHARITDFVVDGRGHDTLTLSHQDFASIAQVLARTTMNNGSAVIHVSPEDTIRLAGVTKTELAANKGDFAFVA